MKKLLFITNIGKGKIGNFSRSSLEAAKQLGIEFHVVANQGENFDKENVKEDSGAFLHHIDCARNPFHPKNIKAYYQLLELIQKEKFDIIHCNTPIGGVLGRVCGKKAKVEKVIYTAHGFHFYKGAPLINNIVYKLIEFKLAHGTDKLITMNEEDYQNAKKMKLRNNGEVYKVHGIGIKTDEFIIENFDKEKYKKQIGLNQDDIMLISMGDLIKRKNYDTAIKAIAKCNNLNLHYIICGNGPKKGELEKLAKKLNIENQIHFLGFRTDVKELLNCADIFLFSTYQEGLPRSMMEAMSSGLPCVASNIRGNVDLLKTKEYLFSPTDVEGFANAINELASNKELRNNIGKKNIIDVKEFDVSNVKKEMKKIYEEVLNWNL